MTTIFMSDPGFWQGAILGLVSGLVLSGLTAIIITANLVQRNDIYDVDHWKLNVKVPFTTMWMNMGYWITTDGQPIKDFQQACRTLLHEVLADSGILERDVKPKLSILDLGIGCGDQSLELARLANQSGYHGYDYVGLTLNESQFRLASKRLSVALQDSDSAVGSVKVFQADAARPDTWAPPINEAVQSLKGSRSTDSERWVLGLDSLYHFSPSRSPIFKYAAKDLDASFMAFDLMLNENASFKNRIFVKIISLAMKCPRDTFVTKEQYQSQLKEAGYDEKHVQIRDITDHVFSGLVNYISQQDHELRPYGISVGKFKVASKMFRWFAKSKVLKAVIIVARKKPKMT